MRQKKAMLLAQFDLIILYSNCSQDKFLGNFCCNSTSSSPKPFISASKNAQIRLQSDGGYRCFLASRYKAMQNQLMVHFLRVIKQMPATTYLDCSCHSTTWSRSNRLGEVMPQAKQSPSAVCCSQPGAWQFISSCSYCQATKLEGFSNPPWPTMHSQQAMFSLVGYTQSCEGLEESDGRQSRIASKHASQ